MPHTKRILYVEDDADDAELLYDAFKKVDVSTMVEVAPNGRIALEQLRSCSNTRQLPDVIILDLNMPFVNGRETFRHIKNEPVWENIPLVVFTSSENPNDRAFFQELGIEMITKPSHFPAIYEVAAYILAHYPKPLA